MKKIDFTPWRLTDAFKSKISLVELISFPPIPRNICRQWWHTDPSFLSTPSIPHAPKPQLFQSWWASSIGYVANTKPLPGVRPSLAGGAFQCLCPGRLRPWPERSPGLRPVLPRPLLPAPSPTLHPITLPLPERTEVALIKQSKQTPVEIATAHHFSIR